MGSFAKTGGLITGGIAANEIVVGGWFVHDGDDCIGAIDQQTSTLRNESGGTKFAAFEGIGALE
ncbi:hypothetical protein N7468_002763 [Penicillium chermesinum]|uniref:Uncharacterized protein n=1 Tax=Penicillium chermesinum TaxID=63820 RepID=A0A9W9TXX8_9EURO|nr:uncharacterized protein N7468_002763 [Penicillium chermesinum]KAJ5247780.1 hypothetical protein N7468_002763 [Penicillium chermesinum]